MRPLISVVIPSFNCADTIGTTLQSMIDQTYQELEIIVVDDGSTDDTKRVVEEYQHRDARIQYYKLADTDLKRVNKRGRNVNVGWAARNYGISKAQGEWVTFQDADDASLLNRIEVQHRLAEKYHANHICIESVQFDEDLVGKKLDVEKFLTDYPDSIIGTEEIVHLAKRTKGIIPKVLGHFHEYIPFEVKRARVINRLFFGSLEPYPGTGGVPMVRKEIFEKVLFRPLGKRVWPSFTGRGVDRDFNFRVAEVYKKSVTVSIPLYLWRSTYVHPKLEEYKKYIH